LAYTTLDRLCAVLQYNLYITFILLSHTRGAQVRITQFTYKLHHTCLYLVSV